MRAAALIAVVVDGVVYASSTGGLDLLVFPTASTIA